MNKLRLNIDGKEVTGYKGQTILQVAEENGIHIPTLCHDERVKAYASCGICLVEAEGVPKLLRSCSTEIEDGMVIKTNTRRVLESRKTNLELLLSGHSGDCRPPCVLACPAHTDCQGYVGLIANGENDAAIRLIKEQIPLPASIGRVCPHPCESACRRKLVDDPISILNLKRYAADLDLGKADPYLPECAPAVGKSVAIIGGGPSGLSAAYFLRQMGYHVTIYDAMPKLGGMLRYGIPEYRLPKVVLDQEIALIAKMGVELVCNTKIGRDLTMDRIRKKHDAVIISIGAWTSSTLPCTGNDLDGVFGGIDFLRRVVQNEPIQIGETVAVVGGGNTAMDACRTLIRLGAKKVYNIYRRTRAEMPAEDLEITEAEEEGVEFKFLASPLELISDEDGKVCKMRLQKMKLGDPDASGRCRPEPMEGAEEILAVDNVIVAVGQGIDPSGMSNIELTTGRTIVADENTFATCTPGVFAIGDCCNRGASIAIEAIAKAKMAAASVDRYLSGKEVKYRPPYFVTRKDLTEEDFADQKKEHRYRLFACKAEDRKDNFMELTRGFSAETAKKEAARCLECGCQDYFECKLISMSHQFDVDPERFLDDTPRIEYKNEHPFIVRDPNKCILCGLCTRVCEEVVGVGALGLVGRGFGTTVMPAMEAPLTATGCISCGQCVSVCPTGALGERAINHKNVPLDTNKIETTCGFCSIGCQTCLESTGNMLVRAIPAKTEGINSALMCGMGRFGVTTFAEHGRLTRPLVRKNGKLIEITWYDAFVQIGKKLKSLKVKGEKTAVSVGHCFTVEDGGAIVALAGTLGADAFSFNHIRNGVKQVLGYDASPNTFEEIPSCEVLLSVGSTPVTNPVINYKFRQAAERGAKIFHLDTDGKKAHVDCDKIAVNNSTAFLKEVSKALIDLGCQPKSAEGLDELKGALAAITPSDEAKRVAQVLQKAKHAMIVFSMSEVSPAGAAEIANIAVLSGHINSPRNGIVMLRPQAGSQTVADLGVDEGYDAVRGVKAMVIFGEDPKADLSDVGFLVVVDTHLTKTAAKADLVIPMPTYAEIDGHFVNSERRIQSVSKAVVGPAQYRVSEICAEIAAIVECEAPSGTIQSMYPHVGVGECVPLPASTVCLAVVPECALFEETIPTNSRMMAIQAAIPTPATK